MIVLGLRLRFFRRHLELGLFGNLNLQLFQMLLIVFEGDDGLRAILVRALEGERVEDAHFESTHRLDSLCATLGWADVLFLLARQGKSFSWKDSLAEDCLATNALHRVEGNVPANLAGELL